jgi:hypothetical protein
LRFQGGARAEHTYALFVLVGINPDWKAQGPRIGIETNLKSQEGLWWIDKKMANEKFWEKSWFW